VPSQSILIEALQNLLHRFAAPNFESSTQFVGCDFLLHWNHPLHRPCSLGTTSFKNIHIASLIRRPRPLSMASACALQSASIRIRIDAFFISILQQEGGVQVACSRGH
jgi:hypothetical protein